MPFVLVDSEALEELLEQAYGNERCYADRLMPDDPVTVLAVQAGLQLPGPMYEGTVPPAPPEHKCGHYHVSRRKK